MSILSPMRALFDFLFRRRRVEQEMEEELRSHLRDRADDLARQGLSRAEAERQARTEFGGYQRYKEECREALGTRLLGELVADMRYGLRQLRRSPGFTAVAVITLALGIGANTAIFSLIDALMLRSMPVRDPAQLVVFRWSARKAPGYHGYSSFGDCPTRVGAADSSGCSFALPIFENIRAEAKVFSGVAAFAGPAQLDLSGNGPASIARGEFVSGDYFSTLGVGTAAGRPIGPADDSPGASPVLVLSYAYWQKAFGGEPSAIGRVINLNNIPFTIIGVAAPAFTRLSPGKTQDFWLPLAMVPRLGIGWARNMNDLTNWWAVIIARLRPGVSRARAQAAASLLFRDELLHGSKPLSKASDNPALILVLAQDGLSGIRGMFSAQLYVLMFAVGLILLIACANVAGLLLARATTRAKEMAVRLAIGAGRARILRQLLTESVMISLAGGALGIGFAYWGVRVITGLISSGSHELALAVTPDWRILAFTIAVSVATGILFGLAPALRSTHVDLSPALKETEATTVGAGARRGRRIADMLVVVQVGLSVVVLAGATLLVRTLENLRDVNVGFDTQHVLMFGLDPTLAGYKDARIQNLYRTLEERLAALPGVTSVSYSSNALLSGDLWSTDVHLAGDPAKKSLPVDMLSTGPGFFRTMHIPLLAGRKFTAEDFDLAAEAKAASAAEQQEGLKAKALRAPASIPVLVNAAFVRVNLHNHNPLGKLIAENIAPWQAGQAPSPAWQIVGVVGDIRNVELRRSVQPAIFLPSSGGGAEFELRTAVNPAALIASVRKAANRIDNRLPLFDITTQSQTIDELLMRERLVARLGSFFGALAILLACIGLYGLLSYEVTRRTRELGIRMALGAQKRDLLAHVLGQGIILALIGAGIGIGAAIGLTRFLSSLLYGVKPTDPLTYIAVALILTGVALLACYIPARRAAKVDPIVALRYE